MNKKLTSITVKGKHKSWSFHFYDNQRYIDEWREDGLDVELVCNVIPQRMPVKLWCFMQDLFHFNFKR